MRRPRIPLAAILLLGLLAPAPGGAWLTPGHRRLTLAAVERLGGDLPLFLRAGAATVAHLSVDPDLYRNPGTPELRRREEVEHYLDVERLGGRPLPSRRVDLDQLRLSSGFSPAELGYLPYAVIEGTERLSICLAEHRRWPGNPHVRAKCLVFAGLLAHYGADLAQPLHTTIHHDGWALPDGRSPLTGFHRRVDALFERVDFDDEATLAGLDVRPFEDLFAGVTAELAASHARLDATYRLEPLLESAHGHRHPEVVAFTCERYRAAALFLARLFATAWEKSASIELPDWLHRESDRLEPVRTAPEGG